MDLRHEVQKGLRDFVKTMQGVKIEAAKVKAVDSVTETVDVELVDGLVLYEVLLTAPATTNKIVVFPKLGSQVFVGQIGDSDSRYCVLSFSEVDKVKGEIQTVKFEIAADGLQIVKGNQSLKVVLNDILDKVKTLKILTTTGTATLLPTEIPLLEALKTRLNSILK
jgi:hypothetical protein